MELFLRTFSGLGKPPLYELSPLYGYRLKPNQIIAPVGGAGFLYAARMRINNFGLRAADAWSPDLEGKILFLGDSVTYGGRYIDDNKLFSSVAGGRLPGWEVGNGASNAWGVENLIGLVKDYGFLPAEVVVTCVIEGDFYRGLTRASSVPLWTKRPRFALQDLFMHFVWRANELRYGNSIDALVQDEDHLDKIVDRAARRLQSMDRYLKHHKVRHFLFILPTRAQLIHGEPPDFRVAMALKRYEIDAAYLLGGLRALEPSKRKRQEWFQDEVHLESSGHQAYGILIGEALANVLAERKAAD